MNFGIAFTDPFMGRLWFLLIILISHLVLNKIGKWWDRLHIIKTVPIDDKTRVQVRIDGEHIIEGPTCRIEVQRKTRFGWSCVYREGNYIYGKFEDKGAGWIKYVVGEYYKTTDKRTEWDTLDADLMQIKRQALDRQIAILSRELETL